MRNLVSIRNYVIACCIAAAPHAAFAYNPQWLECTGQVTITPAGGAPTQQPVKDIYAFDPDAQNLFKYSEEQKRLSYLGAKVDADQAVRWSGTSSGIGGTTWDGRLDRKAGNLQLSYKSDGETRVWAESCKPTEARPES